MKIRSFQKSKQKYVMKQLLLEFKLYLYYFYVGGNLNKLLFSVQFY